MSTLPEHPRKALGKGLSALLPDRPPPPSRTDAEHLGEAIVYIPIDDIAPNHLQPRTVFQPDRLAELAQSIRTNGILQPLLVRRIGDHYELVAGERRWRAARTAGLTRVPALIHDLADERLLETSLVENIQREDLNPIEMAQAFDRMGRELNLSHEQIGHRTGKDRSTITNMLRLLRLPDEVQLLLAERRLSMGHAKVILGLPSPDLQRQVADQTTAQGYSVRQVERLVQRMTEPREPKPAEQLEDDPNVKAAMKDLEGVLGTRVRIVQRSEQRGHMEIEYYSLDDLNRIYEIIVGDQKTASGGAGGRT